MSEISSLNKKLNKVVTILLKEGYQTVQRDGMLSSSCSVQDHWTKCISYLTSAGLMIPNSICTMDVFKHLAPYLYCIPVEGCAPHICKKSKCVHYTVGQWAKMFVDSRWRMAQDYLRRVSELAKIIGVEISAKNVERYIGLYFILNVVDEIIPQMKYSTNLIFNDFWEEIPPNGGTNTHFGYKIFPKQISSRLKSFMNDFGRRKYRNQVIMNTLFQGFKRGLLPCSPSIVQKTLNKHRAALTKQVDVEEGTLDRVARLTREILQGWRIPKDWKESMSQSSSSTLEFNYSRGGNIGGAMDYVYGENRECEPSHFELMGYMREAKRFMQPIPVYKCRPLYLFDVLEVYEDKPNSDQNLKAAPACILEPMKVRMITKPTAGLHVRLHKIQKSLFRYLFTHSSGHFDLIGKPLDRMDIERIAMHWVSGDKFGSGDYTGATDNLYVDISRTITREIRDIIVRDTGNVMLGWNLETSLMNMEILQTKTVLPKYSDEVDQFYNWELFDFMQTNGQLMGHVVSFVILCIANYCSYHISRERHEKKKFEFGEFRGTRRDVLINGDDILFLSKQEHYTCWLETIKEFGFDPSVGKNYFNDKFLQVNSELWRFDATYKRGIPLRNVVKIPFVNFGYLTNRRKMDCTKDMTMDRVGEHLSEEGIIGRFKNIGKIYQSLMEDLPVQIATRVSDVFKSHNKEMMRHFDVPSLSSLLYYPPIGESIASLVKNEKDPLSEIYPLFGDLSNKLDRGTLTFEKRNVKNLMSVHKDFLIMDVEALFDVPKEEEVTWIRC